MQIGAEALCFMRTLSAVNTPCPLCLHLFVCALCEGLGLHAVCRSSSALLPSADAGTRHAAH